MGGPLVCEAKSNSEQCNGYYLAGITIAGSSSCGLPGRPSLYTAIYPHIEWIRSEIYEISDRTRQTIVCPEHIDEKQPNKVIYYNSYPLILPNASHAVVQYLPHLYE